MGFVNWIFYIICGFFLFIFLYILKNKFKINNFQSIVFSLLFMLIIAGICTKYGFSKLNVNIFLVFVFEMVFKIIYYSYFLDDDFFDKEENNILYYVVLIIIGYILNIYFVNKVNSVFLSSEDIRIITWLVMFLFLYQFLRDNDFFKKVEVNNSKKILSDQRIYINYAKLKSSYNAFINYDNKDINNILYSIMIFENNRRPKFLRGIDNFRYRFDGGVKKLGIMQVETKRFISDIESIDIVYKKINKLYDKYTNKNKTDFNKVISSYDKENCNEIIYIFDKISKF